MSAAFLSAIVNTAIMSLALTAVISLVFLVCGIRFWNASTRSAVWLVALVVTAALPLAYARLHSFQAFEWASEVAFTQPAAPLPGDIGKRDLEAIGNTTIADGNRVGIERSRPGALSALEIPAGPWTKWILAAWALTSAFLLSRLLVSYILLHQRKARALPMPGRTHADDWMKLCGSKRRIRVAISDEIATPVAAGPFRPFILIPTPLLEGLHSEELDQIGIHEAAHFARRDDYALLFQRICEAVFVFHPVVRWITGRLDLEREIACDDFVVKATRRARSYALCLTRVVELANGMVTSPLAAPAVETRSVLERRLNMLLDKNRKAGTHVLKAHVLVLLALIATALGIASAGPEWVVFATPIESAQTQAIATVPVTPVAVIPAAGGPTPVKETLVAMVTQTPELPRADARDNLNRGVQAYRTGNLQAAVDYFGRATQLDPDLTTAELYLGTAYAAMYIPGQQSPENAENANRAVRSFESVLRKQPSNVDAIIGIATIYQNRGEMLPAHDQYMAAARLAPQNVSVLYAIGALDWILVYDKKTPQPPMGQALLIEEGLEHLDRALAIDPQHDDAMTYMNLLLREKAKLTNDQEERIRFTTQADEWFSRALQTRQQNVQTGRQRTAPAVAGLTVPSPPPPPPPTRINPDLVGEIRTILAPVDRALQRIGGDVAQANLVFQPKPVYPALAKAARVQDYVMLQTVIDREGKVTSLTILKGHPLLNEAAMDAVKQWRYRPQTLNGQPIDVITTVTVTFSFQ